MKIQKAIIKQANKILIITCLVIAFGIIQKINGQYYYYDSGTDTYPYQQGCNETLDVRIDSENRAIRAGRFHIIFDPSKFSYDTSPDPNTLRTNLFDAGNQTFIDRSSALSPSRKDPSKKILQIDRTNTTIDYNGDQGIYGTIKFVPLYNISAFYGSFGMEYLAGSYTTETTLSRTGGVETINSTHQIPHLTGNYLVLQEPCVADTNNPSISIISPADQSNKQHNGSGISLSLNEAAGVNGITNVPYIWTGGHSIWTGNPGGSISNQYGIDLNTFSLEINGNGHSKNFTGGSPGVSAIGNARTRQDYFKNYTINIDGAQIFDYGIEKTITISTTVDDRKGNTAGQNTIMFNYPIGPRLLGAPTPNNGNIFVNTTAPIILGIQDNRAGVDSGSIKITLAGTNGTSYGPYIFSGIDLNLSGLESTANQPNYSIRINNHPPFPTSGNIKVTVYAKDMEDNPDNISDYTFSTRPSCSDLQCCDVTIITRDQTIPYNNNILYISGYQSPTFYTGSDGSGYINCNSQDIGLKIYKGEGINTGSRSILSSYYDRPILMLSGRAGTRAVLSGNTIYLSIINLFGFNRTGAILFSGWELSTGTLVGPTDLNISTQNAFNSGVVIQSTGNEASPEVIEAYLQEHTVILQTGNSCLPLVISHPTMTGKQQASASLIDYNIYSAFHIGFICTGTQARFYDTSGNVKEVEIRVRDQNLVDGVSKVRYSTDLINRSTVGTANVINHVASFKTIRFAYFAIGNLKPIREQPPPGGGGPITIVKDDCPDGDYSESYYDKECGSPDEHQITNFCGVGRTTYAQERVDAFQYAYGLGITTMCPIEKANLDGYILRKELAKMISEFAIKVIGIYPNFSKTECDRYRDIGKESEELQFYMKLSCRLGLMGLHTDGITVKANFDPNDYVDRAQFGTIMSRLIFGGKYNGNRDNRYIDHLKALKSYKIMKYIDNPSMKELRSYVMIMMQRTDESGIAKEMRSARDFINGVSNLWDIQLYNPPEEE